MFNIFLHRKRYEVIKHDRTQNALAHDWRNQSSWNKFEHAAKVTTYALVYINEVLHYQFVHRKISTLTFETHHVVQQNGRGGAKMFGAFDITVAEEGGGRIFLFRHQNPEQNPKIIIANRKLQNVASVKIDIEEKDIVLFGG